MLTMMCLHVNQRVHVAYNFKCLFETELLFKVTSSHIHGKSGNTSETVKHGDVVTTGNNIWLSNSGNYNDTE